MTDDYYEFNEDRMVFVGARKRKVFKLGDSVRVRAVRADLDLRQIDFTMIN
jgi:ribonuclease R